MTQIGRDVWHYFFDRFFQLKSQFEDVQILRLLNLMKGNGSNLLPDQDTFSSILAGLLASQGNKQRYWYADIITDEIMDVYGVRRKDLRCYAKIALFWKIGKCMPLNKVDKQCFRCYQDLGLVTRHCNRELMARAFSRMKEFYRLISSEACAPSKYPSFATILHSSREKWIKHCE